jgi:hypothetical protein
LAAKGSLHFAIAVRSSHDAGDSPQSGRPRGTPHDLLERRERNEQNERREQAHLEAVQREAAEEAKQMILRRMPDEVAWLVVLINKSNPWLFLQALEHASGREMNEHAGGMGVSLPPTEFAR